MNHPADLPLTGVVTTDLSAITRGRFVPTARFEEGLPRGVGWVPANIGLTAFGDLASPNLFGSRGDLRLVPDSLARYRTGCSGSATPFDIAMGDLLNLDGSPWALCTRHHLRQALAMLKAHCGLTLHVAFEQEFLLQGPGLGVAAPFSVQALRRTDPLGPRLMAALTQAGVEPEVFIAEYGTDQFELTCAPADGLVAADRCVAIREITREVARNLGWRASFTPKSSPQAAGAGVHIHFSFWDDAGQPCTYAADRPGGLSPLAGAFCAGVLQHLAALAAYTAPSVVSYHRLGPHHWSSAYTWLGEKNREATLRICPTVAFGASDTASQFNVEFRACDASANPYLALAALVQAGLEGVRAALPCPPLVDDDPTGMTEAQRQNLGLRPLPASLPDALAALQDDPVARAWFGPEFLATYLLVKRTEAAGLADLTPEAQCERYLGVY